MSYIQLITFLGLFISLSPQVDGQVGSGFFGRIFFGRPSDDRDLGGQSSDIDRKNSSGNSDSQIRKTLDFNINQIDTSTSNSSNGLRLLSQGVESSKASKFGVPNGNNLKVCENYIISYDCRLKHPNWVLQHLTPEHMLNANGSSRKLSKFYPDTTLHKYFRATNEDYFNSGFTRGHLCPANNNQVNQAMMDQSFCLSNIAPQVPGLNHGPWLKLEEYVNYLATRSKNMYIISGTNYIPLRFANKGIMVYEVIGGNEVSAPTHFYKVWVREDQNGILSMEGFVLPNSNDINANTKLASYRIDIDNGLQFLERSTGLIFFDRIDRDRVEKPLRYQLGFEEKQKSDISGRKWADIVDSDSDSEVAGSDASLTHGLSAIDNLQLIVRKLVANEMQPLLQFQEDLMRSIDESKTLNYALLDELRHLARSHNTDIDQLRKEQKIMKDMISDELKTSRTHAIANQIVQKHSTIKHNHEKSLTVVPEVESGANLDNVLQFLTEATKMGLPGSDNLKLGEDYIISRDRVLKHPTWMFEIISGSKKGRRKAAKRRGLFQLDDSKVSTDRVTVGSIKLDTTSIAPQRPFSPTWQGLNGHINGIAVKSKSLFVVTGVLYLPVGNWVSYPTIGKNQVGIPTHFYKVLVFEDRSGKFFMEAYVIPNKNTPRYTKLKKYRIDIEEGLPSIEHAAGVKFFPNFNRTKLQKVKEGHRSISNLELLNFGGPATSYRGVSPGLRSWTEHTDQVAARKVPGVAAISLEIYPEIDPEADVGKAETLLSEVSHIFGLPSEDNLKVSENYILSFDRRLKHPIWVLEHLTNGYNAKTARRFFSLSASTSDYFQMVRNGASQQGRTATAEQRLIIYSQEFCTFGIAPQLLILASPMRLLQNYVDSLAAKSKSLYVITGALYVPGNNEVNRVNYQLIGENQVGVPTKLFKIIVREANGVMSMQAFEISNRTTGQPLARLQIDIDRDLPEIERLSGLKFFHKLDRSKIVKPKLA